MWNSPASGPGEPVGFGPVPDPFTKKRPLTSALQASIKELGPPVGSALPAVLAGSWRGPPPRDRFSFLSSYSLTVSEFLLCPSVYKSPISRVCSPAYLWGPHLFSAGLGRKHLFSCLNKNYRVPVLLGPLSARGHRHVR